MLLSPATFEPKFWKVERQPIGSVDIKDYVQATYTNKESHDKQTRIEWRVPDIREGVRAQSGFRIAAADYSQIEVRLMAYLSGDPWLKEALNSGKDIHCYMAHDVFGQELGFTYEEILEAAKYEIGPRVDELTILRSNIKTVTFGVPYGAGPPRVAAMTGLPVPKAEELIERYFSKAKVLKLWLQDIGNKAVYFGYTTSPRGRKRFYAIPADDDPSKDAIISQIKRWAGNHPIQAGNVDMLKPSMAKIYRRLWKEIYPTGVDYNQARILFAVHDEIVMTGLEHLLPTQKEKEAQGFNPKQAKDDQAYALQWAGPIEKIMMEEMQRAYSSIIPDIINRIDVGVDYRWVKK